MKKLLCFTITMLLGVVGAFAQDIIKKCTGEEIKAIVQDVGNYEVTYKLHDKPDGETKILRKNLIFSIVFSNGEREMFNCQEVITQEPPKKEYAPLPDLIVLTNGEEVKGFVEKVGMDEVMYKKVGNPDGPTYTLKQSSISKIRYANGSERSFAIKPPEETQVAVVTEPIRKETPQQDQPTSLPEQMSETGEKSNSNKFRLYVGAGFGNSYGILGANLECRFSHIAFHGGVGWYPYAAIEKPAWSAGIKGYLWKNLYLNTVVGTVGHYEQLTYYQSDNDNYYSAYYEPIIGISELAGYQWAWGNAVRFGINVGVGLSVGFVNQPLFKGSIVAPAFDLGISISFGTKKINN